MPRVNRLEDCVRQPPPDTRRTPPGRHGSSLPATRVPDNTNRPASLGWPHTRVAKQTNDPRSTRTTVSELNRRPATVENPGCVTLARGTCEWLHLGAWLARGSACKPVFNPFDFCFLYFPPDSNHNSILYEIELNWEKITTFRYANCVETLRKGMHHPSKSPRGILGRNTCRSRLECVHASLIILGRSFPWLNVGNCLLKVRCIVWIITGIT